MKKHTVPNEPEEIPIEPEHPEIKQPADPKEPEIPQKEIPELPEKEIPETPQELPPIKSLKDNYSYFSGFTLIADGGALPILLPHILFGLGPICRVKTPPLSNSACVNQGLSKDLPFNIAF
ncbi:MAG: hypothetical protein JWR50_2379 [Mucilaginibacter sp.]|nr:hypothetical protein [Mucilaginibacter sp.]